MSRMPTQKAGIAMNSCEKADSAAPYQRSALYAAMKPISSDSTKASPNARNVRGIVTASREAISGPTGSVLMKELPRSRVIMPRNQLTNCSCSGRSAADLGARRGDLLGCRVDRQQRVGRVAGQGSQEQEDHDHRDQQRDDEDGGATEEVLSHVSLALLPHPAQVCW